MGFRGRQRESPIVTFGLGINFPATSILYERSRRIGLNSWGYRCKMLGAARYSRSVLVDASVDGLCAEKCQTACKPGSVRRTAAKRCGETAIPLRRTLRRACRDLPGRQGGTPLAAAVAGPARRPYSVLLPVGFTLPLPLPATRCALAAPFHPCPPGRDLGRAVCFLWHCPWGRPRRPLAGTVFRGARTFLQPSRLRAPISGRPAVWRGGDARACGGGQAGNGMGIPHATWARCWPRWRTTQDPADAAGVPFADAGAVSPPPPAARPPAAAPTCRCRPGR